MTMGEAVAKRIDKLLIERGWSLYKLAKDSCLPLSTLKNLYRRHTKSPTLSVIFKIAETFKITPIEFLSDEVFKSEELRVYILLFMGYIQCRLLILMTW